MEIRVESPCGVTPLPRQPACSPRPSGPVGVMCACYALKNMVPIFELCVRRWQAHYPVGHRAMLFSPVEATLTWDSMRVMLVCVCVWCVPPLLPGYHACMCDLDEISPRERRANLEAEACMRLNLIRYLSKLNPNLIQACSSTKSRQSSSRLRRGSTGFSASSLLTEKGAFRSLPAPRDWPLGLFKVSSRMLSIRTSPPEAVHDAVAPPVAKLASVGAAPCVGVDACARAAILRADPANRRLPVRAGRRERAE